MNQVIEKKELTNMLLNSPELLPAVQSLTMLNREGLAAFAAAGIPTHKHEEWKYTPVESLHPLNYAASNIPQSPYSGTLPNASSGLRIVLRNGYFDNRLSSPNLASAGIKIHSLAATHKSEAEIGSLIDMHEEPFVALNCALCRDGVVITIEKSADPSTLIEIIHLSDAGTGKQMHSPRIFVKAEKGSEASISESFISAGGNETCWTNAVCEIVIEENAKVNFVKMQLESEGSVLTDFTKAVQASNSTFDIVTVTLDGKLVRNNLHIRHNGTNCTSHLYGLFVADGEQLIDNHTLVDHAMPNCFSNELYKGIVGGKATGVFNGKIFVRKDAQKTNAYQSNKTILLTDEAQMNAKPQLEIYADDVKCTHGATTGQLDEEALFYLRARGIGENTARTLLNIAFAQDVLNNISDGAMRENLTLLVNQKLSDANG
ncbi:MAG TPA: Fe-S cluster assembly protein SufD [Bacteroidia bacterium]|nr:Fe-S cluster assembly protein SufD [Bacteroidia bacterium]